MSYKPNELKAIAWYQEHYGMRVTLSTRPYVYFIDQQGEEHKRNIMHILLEWEAMRKEEKRNKGA
jgi:uncharacterized glyoxalase superfamily protein PhnB